MIALAVLGYLLLIFFDIRPLYQKAQWHDFWVNIALTTFSFVVTVLICLHVKIPSPERPIRELIISIFGK